MRKERDEARADAAAIEAALTLENAFVGELKRELERRGGDHELVMACARRAKAAVRETGS